MAHTFILDTYDYAKALKNANVPEAQIEAEVARDKERTKAINEIIDNNLATKHDISLVQKDIETVRKDLESKIETIKKDIIIKLGYMLIVGFTLTIAILGFLIKR
jgi:hypothetical protein